MEYITVQAGQKWISSRRWIARKILGRIAREEKGFVEGDSHEVGKLWKLYCRSSRVPVTRERERGIRAVVPDEKTLIC